MFYNGRSALPLIFRLKVRSVVAIYDKFAFDSLTCTCFIIEFITVY